MKLVGARLSTIDPGVVEIELSVADELTQQNRFLHAGALLAVLDTACGYAALTLMPTRAEVLTVRTQVQPARARPLRDRKGAR